MALSVFVPIVLAFGVFRELEARELGARVGCASVTLAPSEASSCFSSYSESKSSVSVTIELCSC